MPGPTLKSHRRLLVPSLAPKVIGTTREDPRRPLTSLQQPCELENLVGSSSGLTTSVLQVARALPTIATAFDCGCVAARLDANHAGAGAIA